MKRILSILLVICLSVGLTLQVSAESATHLLENRFSSMKPALVFMVIIAIVLLIACISCTVAAVSANNKGNRSNIFLLCFIYLTTVIVALCTIFCFIRYRQVDSLLQSAKKPPVETTTTTAATEPATEDTTANTAESTETPTEETTELTTPTEPPLPTLAPASTENSDPANWGVKWELQVGDAITENYQSPDTYNFLAGADYYPLPGVAAFMGNNYRTGAAYGTANISEHTLTKQWSQGVGSLDGWPGTGWTGQPLCVQWDDETKAIMNLYDSKKAKAGLVEVIVTALDGYIYFYDLDDGSLTRDPLWIGMSIKGTGLLDPRGYPILYVGSGLSTGDRYPRMFAISLIDFTIMMEHSGSDSFAYRGWYAFDSSPMVSGETDTLFWPGESGVLYAIKLNTQYDKVAGTLTMSPETLVKTHYTTDLNRTVGYESSVVMVGNYMYIGDNGGMFYCVDLHTMQLAWAQNVKDDVNATPIFEWGDDHQGYLYVATSTEHSGNSAYIHKLNATTGEILWSKEYNNVAYDYSVSGGTLSSPVLGKEGTNLEGMLIVSVAKTPTAWSGTLVALDTDTGEVIWEKTIVNYAWSTPVAVYTDSGKGYMLLCDSAGNLFLIDGLTGEILCTENLGSNVESSPVVFNNKLIVGTRGCQIWCVELG